ncbi:XRE family transcriptional regulator [Sphingomonas paeninsulae]|uniref:XRE family transcriptional regulator n=1 Tax=Sphingomonas paeninsulae TaxID=2319844 RepID=A0A494TLW7_SPHPE|nr:XRE family transcriptional regulator [Sphingomonas paeninsulae]
MSRQALADMARISLSTLEKALAGTRPFTLASTLRIEESLGVKLRHGGKATTGSDTAPEDMGAYARSAVGWIEGRYLTLRPSFGTPNAIYAYLTTIRWLPDDGHLGFAESERLDARFEQGGHVSMPNLSGHIYLVTNTTGQHRLMILGRPTIDGVLYGVLTTLQVGPGSQLVPAACPVSLSKLSASDDASMGLIMPESAIYTAYRDRLRRSTADDFARFYPVT